jgi:hypothetical protein
MDALKEVEGNAKKTACGSYIYCIVAGNQVPEGGYGIAGLLDGVLRTICYRDLCAVVSDLPLNNQRATRANMVQHTQVLEKILQFQQMLPVRFGVVARSDAEIISKLLEQDYWHLREILTGLQGKSELSVRVLWQQEQVLNKILASDKEICRLRESLVGKAPEAIHYQKLNLGRMVEAALNQEREQIHKHILEVLLPIVEDHRLNKLITDAMVVNVAVLINSEREPEFAAALDRLDEEYQGMLLIKYTAVAPPYNFVNIAVKL